MIQEKQGPRLKVRWFAEAMEQELRENDEKHPDGWEDDDVVTLGNRLMEELLEFREAVSENAEPAVVLSEAADVANFLMMIADNYATVYNRNLLTGGGDVVKAQPRLLLVK